MATAYAAVTASASTNVAAFPQAPIAPECRKRNFGDVHRPLRPRMRHQIGLGLLSGGNQAETIWIVLARPNPAVQRYDFSRVFEHDGSEAVWLR